MDSSPVMRSARPKSTSRMGVRVIGKIRPFIESDDSHLSNISMFSTSTPEGEYASIVLNDQEKGYRNSYTLDCCYGQDESANNFFIHEVKPLLQGILHGENSCVIAYGAQGSGKTHLIQGSDEIPGLATMTFREILSIIEDVDGSVSISCYEIYKDHIYDLLDQKEQEVQVLEDAAKTIQLKGLSKIPVKSVLDFKKYYFQVSNQQKLWLSAIHDAQFRSHKGLIIYVTHVEKESNCPLVGKINLIDLAGYVDAKKEDEKAYSSERSRVNKSLYALHRVVSALNGDDSYIPYRQTKLTRLLQGFICGSNHAVLIACLSPRLCHDGIRAISMASRSCQFINRQRHDNARIKSKENRRRSQSHNSPINGLYPLDRGMMKQGSYAFGSSGKKIISSSFISYNRHQNRAYDSAYKKPVASAYLPKWRKLSNISTPGTNVARANSCRQEEATELIASTLKGESAGSSAVSVSGAVEEENLSLSGCENSFTAEELQHISDLQECQLRIDDNGSSVTMDGSLYAADIPQNVDPRQEIESGICLHPYSCSPRASKNSSSFDDDKHSPTLTEQLREISNTLKALSSRPICIYTSEIDEPYIEPKTPRLPFSSNLDGHFMSESFTTPQEKFKTRSIGLKKSLMNECLDFLNSASKEELKQLKGIGEKRATRILQLREQTPKPFKEIDDLKGLGLSSKQVKGMMSKVLDI